MKKKLILLPTLLIPVFLSACSYRTEHIALEEFFDIRTDYDSTFVFEENNRRKEYEYFNDTDYNGKVMDIIRENCSDAKLIGKKDGYKTDWRIDTLTYRFRLVDDYKKMDCFVITIYEDGDVYTFAGGSGWPIGPEDQYTAYKISDEAVENIFSKANAYAEELDTYFKEEEDKAKEKATIDNFFTEYSKLDKRTVTYRVEARPYRGRMGYMEFNIEDTDGDILEDMTALEYQASEDNSYYGGETFSCCVNDNSWSLNFRSDYKPYAYMYYMYETKYGDRAVIQYYDVNQEKLATLDNKLYDKIKDQLPEQED